MKYGLEVEFFATDAAGKIINPQSLGVPTDEYPLLCEARGQPSHDPYQAVASVRGEIERMTNLLARGKAVPQFLPRLKKDKHIQTLHRAILRAGLNKRVSHQNTGRHEDVGRSPKAYLYAGLHISITNPRSYTGDNNREVTYFPCFDYPSIFRKLEKEFTSEIKAAYRNPGFYEVKSDGRVEYRSLPATLIHSKNFTARLAAVLEGSPLPIDDDSGDGETGANSTN